MAETVYLKDGAVETVFGNRGEFLETLLRDKLGSDTAQVFTRYIAELRESAAEHAQSAEECERAADGYLAMCREALEGFGEVLTLLAAPRLDRARLELAARAGYDRLYKNL